MAAVTTSKRRSKMNTSTKIAVGLLIVVLLFLFTTCTVGCTGAPTGPATDDQSITIDPKHDRPLPETDTNLVIYPR
jgi:hypothetical protein